MLVIRQQLLNLAKNRCK